MKKTLPVRLGLLESKVCRKGEPIENALDHATITKCTPSERDQNGTRIYKVALFVVPCRKLGSQKQIVQGVLGY